MIYLFPKLWIQYVLCRSNLEDILFGSFQGDPCTVASSKQCITKKQSSMDHIETFATHIFATHSIPIILPLFAIFSPVQIFVELFLRIRVSPSDITQKPLSSTHLKLNTFEYKPDIMSIFDNVTGYNLFLMSLIAAPMNTCCEGKSFTVSYGDSYFGVLEFHQILF